MDEKSNFMSNWYIILTQNNIFEADLKMLIHEGQIVVISIVFTAAICSWYKLIVVWFVHELKIQKQQHSKTHYYKSWLIINYQGFSFVFYNLYSSFCYVQFAFKSSRNNFLFRLQVTFFLMDLCFCYFLLYVFLFWHRRWSLIT